MTTNWAPDRSGDAADQAEHLREVIDLQAAAAGGGHESVDGRGYPLEDAEEVLSAEGADDASDDPMHAGGLKPRRWLTAEEAAMHVIDSNSPDDYDDDDDYHDDDDDDDDDGFVALTPEDETLLGVDPYDLAAHGIKQD